jgi:glycosyltransferase involved in cell wall biosynthesis
MSSAAPSVSVIVTTKNSERTLEDCLQSIKTQTFAPLDVIVVDNFSGDGTRAIAEKYASAVIDAGPERCAQRNIGVRNSTGQYVLIVDSDMVLRSDVIARCVEKAQGSVAAVIVPEESVGSGFWAKCKAFERDFYRNDLVVSAARFFDRAAYTAAGGYDETLVSGEDWDLSMRVEALGELAVADTLIFHDEGVLRLTSLMKKKFYYGRHIRKFIQKHGRGGLKRLNPFRASYNRLASRFLKKPTLALGMAAMRFCEMSAGGAGFLLSYIRAA